MPNYVTAYKTEYVLPPAKRHHAVCVDVIFRKDVKTKYGIQDNYELRWQSADRMEDGKPYLIRRSYNATLGEGSSLRKDLETWRGKPFTADELRRFDLDTCIGANALITIRHVQGEKRMMDEIVLIEKADPKLPKLVAVKYERVTPEAEGDQEPPYSDEDVPF